LHLLDFIGVPQIVALLVLSQRGLEELYSAKNTKALLAEGGREAGSVFYPVVAATHLAWTASLFFLIPSDAIIFERMVQEDFGPLFPTMLLLIPLGRLASERLSIPVLRKRLS